MNINGTLAARYDYEPYGKRIVQYEASGYTCDLGFTGHISQQSAVSGQSEIVLTHYRAYDPNFGKWLSADPIGERGGMNLYAYVMGNPLNALDQFGLRGYPSTFVGPLMDNDYYIPEGPPGSDLSKNCDTARKIINPFTYKNYVKNKGPWDYKQKGKQYENFGNYNYGATGRAFGFSLNTLLNEAGRAQGVAKTGDPRFGKPASRIKMLMGCDGTGSRGDDPVDQTWIQRGYNDNPGPVYTTPPYTIPMGY
jgi:type VI secretion system secreted protein VgrG